MNVSDYAFISKIVQLNGTEGKFVINAPSPSTAQTTKKLEECVAIAINAGDSRGFSEGDSVLVVEAPDTRREVGKWNEPRSFVIIGRIDAS